MQYILGENFKRFDEDRLSKIALEFAEDAAQEALQAFVTTMKDAIWLLDLDDNYMREVVLLAVENLLESKLTEWTWR